MTLSLADLSRRVALRLGYASVDGEALGPTHAIIQTSVKSALAELRTRKIINWADEETPDEYANPLIGFLANEAMLETSRRRPMNEYLAARRMALRELQAAICAPRDGETCPPYEEERAF